MDAALSQTVRPREVPRDRLLERIRSAQPVIVCIAAPAGFGKTTLAANLAASAPAAGICDCRGVVSAADLAQRLIPALAAESPAREASLARGAGQVPAEAASDAERVALAVSAWDVAPPASVFVFDSAEAAVRAPGAAAFLAHLLTRRPAGRSVVIATRESPRMHLSRFAPPHRIVMVRADDLAFNTDEIAAVFGPATDAAVLARVATVSRGWPIAVLLLARFAGEGRLEPLLDTLDDLAYDELHEYLADQVLAETDDDVIEAMLVCAAIPSATDRDCRLALGDGAADALCDFATTSPLVARAGDGTFSVHPLLAATLRERHPGRMEALLAETAAAYAASGEYQRAAEIFVANADPHRAAAMLDEIDVVEAGVPSLAYARVLAALPREVVLSHPRIWSVAALLRAFTVDARALLDDAESMWARLPLTAALAERFSLTVMRALVCGYAGEFAAALALVDDLRRAIAAPAQPLIRMHGWLLALHAQMTARLGEVREAEAELLAAWPFVAGVDLLASSVQLALAADVARVRGDRTAERAHLARAGEHARRSGLANYSALAEAEAALGAWLAGDAAACTDHGFALDELVTREGIRGFAFFAAALRGSEREPQSADQPQWIVCGRLVAAANAADPGAARGHAEAARAAAAAYHAPFYQTLAALALAELDPARRSALHAEAAGFARRIEAPALHAAVDAVVRGDDGAFLAPFVARYRAAEARTARHGGVSVELVTGRVLRDGELVALAEREHALLVALALRPEAVARERLSDTLWPDLPEASARNAFHVCLHRLKTRLGGDGIVVRADDGYRLGPGVDVDLWAIDRALADLRGRASVNDDAALTELHERLRGGRPARFAGWEWFDQTERRLCELRGEIARTLAERALEREDAATVLALCDEMIAADPCDEAARELAIRAMLAAGDRAGALRHFRHYRDVLRAELQCEPSAALAALVGISS